MTVNPNTEQKVTDTNEKKQDVKPDKQGNVETKGQPTEETPEQINWKKFREAREVDRKKREDAERTAQQKGAEAAALKEAMEAILNKQQPVQRDTTSYGEPSEETEEQRIDRQVQAAIKRNDEAREVERRKREAVELPQRLVQAHADFDKVCATENLDYLEYHYPEVARAFKNQPYSFDKWSDIYKTVKRFVPNIDSKKEQAKMERNLAKPQSMSQPGMAQTGDEAPMDLTEKRRQDNWKRMQATLKSIK